MQTKRERIKNMRKSTIQTGFSSAVECIHGLSIGIEHGHVCDNIPQRVEMQSALLVVAFRRVDYIIIFPQATSAKTHTRKRNTHTQKKKTVWNHSLHRAPSSINSYIVHHIKKNSIHNTNANASIA